ncbi:hypothetical protein QYE76_062168 [Lolium multiflorum]|uniref:Transposase (putative) gypsy type domain-containing protein n=1 Tax=Lolium multiflorum TaxID=4521 RepID=A0AAD8S3I6_LOLMU|nr:hypothetical protein QYE76_062168 [Lolium multiflorum]
MAAPDLGVSEWERSKISNQDANLMKKLGLSKKKDALRFPSEESYPTPPMEYRVSLIDHLIHGLSAPIHDFLRGLLFVYGLQLHQLTPNSILHLSIFITLCECFLGVQPNWALWKRIFCLRRNGAHNIAYNIGGVVICVRPDVKYFDVKFPDSVQGWRKKWIRVQPLQARKNPLWMYAGDQDVDRISKDLSKHQVLSSLPPLPEGGEVEERTIVTDENQGTSRPESEVAGSHKSATSCEREAESEASESTQSLPSAVSPTNKRKRDEVADSGTSKAGKSPIEETPPEEEEKAFNPYDDALVSSPCVHLDLFTRAGFLFPSPAISSLPATSSPPPAASSRAAPVLPRPLPCCRAPARSPPALLRQVARRAGIPACPPVPRGLPRLLSRRSTPGATRPAPPALRRPSPVPRVACVHSSSPFAAFMRLARFADFVHVGPSLYIDFCDLFPRLWLRFVDSVCVGLPLYIDFRGLFTWL